MPDTSLLFVHALTGLHAGGGTALGVIDLPVQRERHTDWPLIPGSSLKGVLRSACNRVSESAADLSHEILAAFGPPTSDAADHAGALAFTDARLLAFPVRSLAGVFAWVTCPAALGRLSRDIELTNMGPMPRIPNPDHNAATCCNNSPLVSSDKKMILEEFEFSCTEDVETTRLAKWISSICAGDTGTQQRMGSHFAVLHDDDFTHFARHATEVVARIGLDYELKTVRSGALFYEESVPSESIFYSIVLAHDSKKQGHEATGAQVLEWLQSQPIEYLQIGGGETVGKGICALRFMSRHADGGHQ